MAKVPITRPSDKRMRVPQVRARTVRLHEYEENRAVANNRRLFESACPEAAREIQSQQWNRRREFGE